MTTCYLSTTNTLILLVLTLTVAEETNEVEGYGIYHSVNFTLFTYQSPSNHDNIIIQ